MDGTQRLNQERGQREAPVDRDFTVAGRASAGRRGLAGTAHRLGYQWIVAWLWAFQAIRSMRIWLNVLALMLPPAMRPVSSQPSASALRSTMISPLCSPEDRCPSRTSAYLP